MAYTKLVNQDQFLIRRFKTYEGFDFRDDIMSKFSEDRRGSAVPSYRRIISSGGDASSEYYFDRYSFELKPVTWVHTFGLKTPPYTQYTESFFGHPLVPNFTDLVHLKSVTAEMNAAALSRLHNHLRSSRSDINGFAFLGELRETLAMLRRPLSGLMKEVNRHIYRTDLVRSRIKGMSPIRTRDEIAKSASATTLEINFGWKPFLGDVKTIAEIAAKVVAGQKHRKVHRTSASDSGASWIPGSDWVPPVSAGSRIRATSNFRSIKTEASVKYTCGVDLREECAASALDQVRILSGFTAENIFPAAYELTPYSWLIDYFTNLGDLIEAATTDTSNVVYTVKTDKIVTSCAYGLTPTNFSDQYYITKSLTGAPYTSTIARTTLLRSVIGKPGIPPLIFTHPFENVSRVSNLISLLEQRRPIRR